MGFETGISMRTIVDGVSMICRLRCKSCKSDALVLEIKDKNLNVVCSICGEPFEFSDNSNTFSFREELRRRIDEKERELFIEEEKKERPVVSGNGNGHHRRICRDCENYAEPGSYFCWTCQQKRKEAKKTRVIRLCPQCNEKELRTNQQVCATCKAANEAPRIRLCHRCHENPIYGKANICKVCKAKDEAPRICPNCHQNELPPYKRVCPDCWQLLHKSKKFHLCHGCWKVQLTGNVVYCPACKEKQVTQVHKPQDKKLRLRICPRCQITPLGWHKKLCPDCRDKKPVVVIPAIAP